MEDINIAIDLGSSLTKVVWSCGLTISNCNFLTMEPYILQCNEEYFNTCRSKRIALKSSSSEDSWLKLNKQGDVIAVGFLAQSLKAEVNLKALKYESALYKILAVVGVLAERLQIDSPKINLAVLLPWSEWSDREPLIEQLTKALKSFWFRDNRYRVKLKNWQTLPEGAGLTINRYSRSPCNGTQLTLVFGHRNTSCLVFERGTLVQGDTTNQGFYRLIEEILNQTSGQNRAQLTEVVYQLRRCFEENSLDELDEKNSLISSLCQSERKENREREALKLVTAISRAREYYWVLLKQWLISKVPNNIDTIVFSGGAAWFLHSQLSQHFCDVNTYWGTDIQEHIENHSGFKSLQLNPEDCKSLAYRFVDIYCLHQLQLQSLSATQTASANVES